MIVRNKIKEVSIINCKYEKGKNLIDPLIANVSITSKSAPFLKYYVSEWGNEFYPREKRIDETFEIKAISGRCASGSNPNFYLKIDSEYHLFSVAWSGNFRVLLEYIDHEINLRFYLEEGFETLTKEEFDGYKVYYTKGNSLSIASNKLIDHVRNYIYEGKKFIPPVTFNPWWVYEDSKINETIYKKNVDVVADLGIDVCILDASWFGNRSKDFWEKTRGDWNQENLVRFPSGIKSLSNYVHEKGMKFGIWIEIEAIGDNAKINYVKPEIVAKNNGVSLNMACLGSKENVKWAYGEMAMLIEKLGADYILLDFNIDPYEGCNEIGHDHGKKDGLYYHYKGLYSLLKMVKKQFPEIIIENCSSGGLRCDLGLMEFMDYCYLSDPDFSEISHQCFQGFRLFLPPERINHFTWSYALDRGVDYEPEGASMGRRAISHFDFSNINNTEAIKKYVIRSVSFHAFGMAQPFIELSENDLNLIKNEIAIHKKYIEFIVEADVFVPRFQTVRMFQGNRNPIYVFQKDNKFLIYAFGLEMAEPNSKIAFENVGKIEIIEEIDADYSVENGQITFNIKPQTAQILFFEASSIEGEKVKVTDYLM